MKIDKISLDNYITGNYGEDEQKLQKSMLFNLEEIKEAVDWAVGDFRTQLMCAGVLYIYIYIYIYIFDIHIYI